MKRFLLIIFSSIAISGCATTAGYEEILNDWKGQTEHRLISAWGVPDSVYENGIYKYLSYIRSSSGYMHGIGVYSFSCETTFTFSEGIIVNWRWKGNSCKAEPKKNILDSIVEMFDKQETAEERQAKYDEMRLERIEIEKNEKKAHKERERLNDMVKRLTKDLPE